MGYLIVAHVTKSAPEPAKLSVLPKSIDWSIYQGDDARAFYLDTYAAGQQQKWPFTSMPPAKDMSLEFVPGLESLAVLYGVLQEAELANSFKRGFLNMNLALSNSLQMPVCSLCSDDEGLDFACVSENGRLQRLHCECGDLDIVYENGKLTIQPLLLEDGEPTDLSGVHDPQKGIQVLDRNVDQNPLMHLVATKEVVTFLGGERAQLDLGGEIVENPPRKIASSQPTQQSAPVSGQQKPWWKLW